MRRPLRRQSPARRRVHQHGIDSRWRAFPAIHHNDPDVRGVGRRTARKGGEEIPQAASRSRLAYVFAMSGWSPLLIGLPGDLPAGPGPNGLDDCYLPNSRARSQRHDLYVRNTVADKHNPLPDRVVLALALPRDLALRPLTAGSAAGAAPRPGFTAMIASSHHKTPTQQAAHA